MTNEELAELLAKVKYTAEHGVFDAAEKSMLADMEVVGTALQSLIATAREAEALRAENERLRGALENIANLSLNGCIKVNTMHGLWVGTPDAYAREVLGMPWRTEDPDYSNEVVGGWND